MFNNCTVDTGIEDLLDTAPMIGPQEHKRQKYFKNSILKVFGEKYDLRFRDRSTHVDYIFKKPKQSMNETLAKSVKFMSDEMKHM